MPRLSPIIVAGMHRSGTSRVASPLAALSVDMGSRLLPRDPHNPLGYFEDVEFLELQRKILSRSCASDDRGHPDWGWTETESLERSRHEIQTSHNEMLGSPRLPVHTDGVC